MAEGNTLVLQKNISFGSGKVYSVININETYIALSTNNGIDVYKKGTQELTNKIPKH